MQIYEEDLKEVIRLIELAIEEEDAQKMLFILKEANGIFRTVQADCIDRVLDNGHKHGYTNCNVENG